MRLKSLRNSQEEPIKYLSPTLLTGLALIPLEINPSRVTSIVTPQNISATLLMSLPRNRLEFAQNLPTLTFSVTREDFRNLAWYLSWQVGTYGQPLWSGRRTLVCFRAPSTDQDACTRRSCMPLREIRGLTRSGVTCSSILRLRTSFTERRNRSLYSRTSSRE